MVQRGQHLRFALEAGQPVGVCGEGVGENFECYVTVEGSIGGPIDLAHAALANEGSDIVVAEPGTDFKRHDLWMESSTPFYAQPLCISHLTDLI